MPANMNKYGPVRRKLKKGPTVTITKKVAVPKMKDGTKAGVLALVKKMIAKDTENKFIGWKLEEDVIHNSPIGPADCVPVIQQIVTGTTAQQRIGDRVKPKYLTVKGVISFNPDQPLNTTQNFLVRVVILAQKEHQNGF